MTRQADISDLDLNAYLDGELDAAHARAVEDAVARDRALAARLAAYRDDKARLKTLYGRLSDDPVPAPLLDMIRKSPPPPVTRSWPMAGAIAAALLILAGVAALYLSPFDRSGGDAVEAALQVRDRGGAVKSIALADIAEARRYDSALDRLVHANVEVPDLQRAGYRITGLRFYDKAAEIAYRDGKNRLLTVYLRPSDGKTRFDQFARGGLRVCIWQDDRITTVIAGEMSAAAMQRLASLAYLGLTA